MSIKAYIHKNFENVANYPITRVCAAARRSANDFALPAVAVEEAVLVEEVLVAVLAFDEDALAELADLAGAGSSSLSRKSNKLPPPETMLGLGGANKGVRGVGAGAVAAGAVRTPREAEAETGDPKEEDAGALNEDEALKEEDGIGAGKLEDVAGGAEEPASSFPESST